MQYSKPHLDNMIPTKPHFIQPFLPNYQSAIPISFFKYLSGVDSKKAVLKGLGGKLFEVEINGREFGEGWEAFVRDHELEFGDMLLFGHEGEMLFEVVVFEEATLEREYPSEVKVEQEEEFDDHVVLESSHIGEDGPSMHEKDFLKITIGRCYAKRDDVFIPKRFMMMNNLRERCGDSIDLVDQQARTFPAKLWLNKGADQVFIRDGWRVFCQDNGFGEGDSITFKLIDDGHKLIFQICSLERETSGSSSNKCRHFSITLKESTIRLPNFPINFVRENGLTDKFRKLELQNVSGKSWTVLLTNTKGRARVSGGWLRLMKENELQVGDRIDFDLIKEGNIPVVRFERFRRGKHVNLQMEKSIWREPFSTNG